jgi:hypothetical protein
VIAALRADPRYARRRRRTWIILAVGLLLSVLTIYFSLANRQVESPGHYKVSAPALALLFAGICVLMVCVVFGVATLASGGRMDRRVHALWTGKVGALLFRVACWRLPSLAGATTGTSTAHGAATLIDSLDSATRRRLRHARAVLGRLDGALGELQRREQELQAAVSDVKAGGAPAAGTASGRQQALLQDLDRARQAAVDRRLAIVATVENVRLAVLRLKSGLGASDEVERELADAGRLLDEKPA